MWIAPSSARHSAATGEVGREAPNLIDTAGPTHLWPRLDLGILGAVKSLGGILVTLLTLALVVAVVGIVLLTSQAGWRLELSRWLLTLSVGLLTAGGIAGVFKVIDRQQADRAEWRSKLADLKAAQDAVQKSRLRMAAHQSARSYSDEMAGLVTARETLRRAFGEGEVDAATHADAKALWQYLEGLAIEYRDHYFEVSRQQRADEARLSMTLRAYAEGDDMALTNEYFAPPKAYEMIQALPLYASFIDDDEFQASEFMVGYKKLRHRLRTRLRVKGIADGS